MDPTSFFSLPLCHKSSTRSCLSLLVATRYITTCHSQLLRQNKIQSHFSFLFSKAVFLFLLRCIPLPPFFYLLGLMRIHLVIIRLVSPGRCDFTNDYRSCTSSDWCGFIQQSSFLYLLGLMRIHLAIIVLVTPRIDADSSRDYRSRIFPDGCGFIQRLPLLRIHLSHSSWTIQENPAGARAAGWT